MAAAGPVTRFAQCVHALLSHRNLLYVAEQSTADMPEPAPDPTDHAVCDPTPDLPQTMHPDSSLNPSELSL